MRHTPQAWTLSEQLPGPGLRVAQGDKLQRLRLALQDRRAHRSMMLHGLHRTGYRIWSPRRALDCVAIQSGRDQDQEEGSVALVPAPAPQQLGEESPPERAEGEQRAEQRDRVDALSALPCPVVVFEVQPEGELVERQRGAAAERGGVVREERRSSFTPISSIHR